VKIAVLGGGVVGITTAYQLQQDGHEVVVVDRKPGVGQECSFANGGFVAISQSIPWSAPGALWRILRTMAQPDAPILFKPSQLPHVWRWGLEFIANSHEERCWENTKSVLRLALYSIETLRQFRQETNLPYSHRTNGCLKIYVDQRSLDGAATEQEPQKKLGLEFEVVSAERCMQLAPALRATEHALAGGIFVPAEEGGDCHEFTTALARLIVERGATLRLSSSIEAIEFDGDGIKSVRTSSGTVTADRYVLATGADAPLHMSRLGVRIPIVPVKGYSMTVPRHTWTDAPNLQIVDENHLFGLNPLGNDRIRLAGLAEISGYDTAPEPRRTKAFFAGFLSRFPQLRACLDQTDKVPFCCLRPVTPNGMPILGKSRFKNLFYNIGHGHLGWSLCHGTARILADLMSNRTPDIDPSPYSTAHS
jgi:D-amino-acid dehydrogenase